MIDKKYSNRPTCTESGGVPPCTENEEVIKQSTKVDDTNTLSSEEAEQIATQFMVPSVFKLLRYFSITSFLGIFAVVVALFFLYSTLSYKALLAHEERSNATLTQVFANSLWSAYTAFFERATHIPIEDLPYQPEIPRLRADVQQQMQGLNIVRVRVYNLDGLTVFSTDSKQIGLDESKNPYFQSAKVGKIASMIAFRDQFSAFDQVIANRNLIASYVPIRTNRSAPIRGVLEVHSDVTDLVTSLKRTQWQIIIGVSGSLITLYAFLFLIVRRADRIISHSSEKLRLENEAKLAYMAFHDPLTGLPNRAGFVRRLDENTKLAKRTGRLFGLLFLDLDRFKDVNDMLGHVAGDILLQEVAERLKQTVRETDLVARLGGDEFVVLLGEVKQMENFAHVANKLLNAVAKHTYSLEGQEIKITVSIGISIFPTDGHNADILIKHSDVAMYHAKQNGRNNYQFYTDEMNARTLAILSVEQNLRLAIERNEFILYYQPEIDVETGRIVACEALIRWNHPTMGLTPPSSFISIAEERGMIAAIGEWVLREAARQNREWQDMGLPLIPICVNLSALQVHDRWLPQTISRTIETAGIQPAGIELEITESVIMQDAEIAIETVRELRAMGLHITIDDFGTGYSSLSYLKRFPIDKLKIDGSFVRGLPFDADDVAIVCTVVAMAKALRLKVVAEGVETQEQLDFLRIQRCDLIQGFYYSRAVPPEEFMHLLRTQPWLKHANPPTGFVDTFKA